MYIVPEPITEQARDLPKRYTCFGHVELDVAAPSAGKAAGSRSTAGGILQATEFVEQAAGDDCRVDATCSEGRRYSERLNHHLAGGNGVAHHQNDTSANPRRDEHQEQLESDSQAQAKPAQVNLAGLALQKVQ